MNVYVMSSSVEALLPAEVMPVVHGYWIGHARWEVIRGVLPMGHNITGAYVYRGAALPNELEPLEDLLGQASTVAPHRSASILTPERQRIQAMKKSDVGFIWLGGSVYPEMVADAAMLYGMGKEVVVAAPSTQELLCYPLLVEMLYQRACICQHGQFRAYEIAMSDVDLHVQKKFVLFSSKYGGLCRGCGGPYNIGEPIMWSRNEGVYHKDCYDAMNDPSKANPAMFSADLVNTLRKRNNELEHENTMWMARVSELERRGA